jgi:hypothetical protein
MVRKGYSFKKSGSLHSEHFFTIFRVNGLFLVAFLSHINGTEAAGGVASVAWSSSKVTEWEEFLWKEDNSAFLFHFC